MTTLHELASRADESARALRAAIVAERQAGRTLQSIAEEIGWTRAGVAYVVKKAEESHLTTNGTGGVY